MLCVGGATLGGSGRTPLAIACARALAARSLRVVLVGHAYGAHPRQPRVVQPGDDARLVGDEALECAHALLPIGVRVIVAPHRQDAIDAAHDADVIVLDGPLQLEPRRATLSLLSVSAEAPWGSGACPPLGDLRATRGALEGAADRTLVIGTDVPVRSDGVWLGSDELLPWKSLCGVRVGLATGIGRPERVEALVRNHGVVPTRVVRVANHARLDLDAHPSVELWLVTGKDHQRRGGWGTGGVKTARIDYHLDLPPFVNELLTSRFSVRF